MKQKKAIIYSLRIFNIILALFILQLNSAFAKENGNILSGDSIATVSISVVGDIMCHSTQFKWARVAEDSFDFNPTYEFVKPFISNSDFAIGNLETVIANTPKKYSGYPTFQTPYHFVGGLKYAGFDILTTANNHSTDGRKSGIIKTLETIKKYRMNYTGTYLNERDRDSLRIFNANGIKFSVLSYSYGLNIWNLHEKDKYMINIIDTLQIKKDIQNAKSDDIDFLVVYLHIGEEYHRMPNAYQKEITNKVVSYGADVIVCSSPHVLQPLDIVENKKSNCDSTLIAYSLGNFLSNQRWRYSDCGLILSFTIKKNMNTSRINFGMIEYLPVWVFKGNTAQGNKYIILPSENYKSPEKFEFLRTNDIKQMQQSFEDTRLILNKFTTRPKIKSLFTP